MSNQKFWEHDYVATSTADKLEPVDSTIREAHAVLDKLKSLLAEKNKSYGDSALSDVNLFCNLSSLQLLEGQIEHKLRRFKTLGVDGDSEDTLMDLMGYLTLFMVAVNRERQ
jgi:glutaredoxin 2